MAEASRFHSAKEKFPLVWNNCRWIHSICGPGTQGVWGHTAERTSEGGLRESCWELHLTSLILSSSLAWQLGCGRRNWCSQDTPGLSGSALAQCHSQPRRNSLPQRQPGCCLTCLGRRSAAQKAWRAPGMTGVQTAAQQLGRSPEDPVQHFRRQQENSPKDKSYHWGTPWPHQLGDVDANV